MYSDKTLTDIHPDLSLYIEGLLNLPEQEVKHDQPVIEKQKLPDIKVKTSVVQQEVVEKESVKVPDWAQQSFECLLVNLAGMQVMVPAMSVSYIEKINKKITRLPLDNEAFYGVVTIRDKSIAVIDLLSLIAESASTDFQCNKKIGEHYIDHVIVMDEGNFALACEQVSHMMTLDVEDVRWNTATFNNPMFSGIVTEHLCPILNIDNLNKAVGKMSFVQSLISRNN